MNSTFPDAIFVQKRLVITQTLLGRGTLLSNSLKIIEKEVATKSDVDDDQIKVVLKTSSNPFFFVGFEGRDLRCEIASCNLRIMHAQMALDLKK
jgi:hypothetical protein